MEWAARADHMKGVPRKMLIMAVGAFAKVVANFLNTTSVHNADTLINLVQSRPQGVPLISVSNHMSTSVPVSFFLFHFVFHFLWSEWLCHSYSSCMHKWNRLDDPVMWGFRGFPTMDAELARWVLAAEDICFKNSILSYFFRVGTFWFLKAF